MNATLALSIVRSKWTYFGLMALVIAVQTLRANHHEARADNCEIARANDRKAYELAAKQAEAKAIAQKQAVEAYHRAKAEENDREHQEELADALAAARRYAAANRVLRSASGSSSGPASPADSGSPENPDGQGGETFLVAVTNRDIDICTKNTLRLESGFDWAATLNLVPPDPAYGKD